MSEAWLYKRGDTVVVHMCPGEEGLHTWIEGKLQETIARGCDHAIHVVRGEHFKWEGGDWRPYDGIPECIARQTRDQKELEFIDNWPRRRG